MKLKDVNQIERLLAKTESMSTDDFDAVTVARSSARPRIKSVASEIERRPNVGAVSIDESVEDANFHTAIAFKCGESSHEVRFSLHANLVVITDESELDPPVAEAIEEATERAGFSLVDESILGEPFSRRKRFNDDLFHRLFDYI